MDYHRGHPHSDRQNADREAKAGGCQAKAEEADREAKAEEAGDVGGLPHRASTVRRAECGQRLKQIRLAADYHTWHLWWGLRGLPAGQRKALANCGMLATDPSTLKHPAPRTLSAQASPIV